MDTQRIYEKFLVRCAGLADALAIEDLLRWNARVVPAPQGGDYRARLMGHQAGILQGLRTDPEYVECVKELEVARVAGSLDSLQSANVAWAAKQVDRSSKAPKELVIEVAAASSRTQDAWTEARKTGDGGDYLLALNNFLRLKREEGRLYNPSSPYDGLMEEFEPGITAAEIQVRFDALKEPLQALMSKASSNKTDKQAPSTVVPRDAQERMAQALVKRMGFEGRLDVIDTHPFSIGIHPYDARCVVRYNGDARPFHFQCLKGLFFVMVQL